MVRDLLNYDKLVNYLRKKGYKEIREGEFIVNKDEEFEIIDILVIRKGQNYKEDLNKLKKEIEESISIVEGERKVYGILFVDNYVILLRRVTEGLKSKVVILRKSIDKISPAFEKKFKKLLKNIGNWEYWDELFDRSDIIEEFYKLYIKARENLLQNIKGISDDKRKEEFADNLLMQLLIIWYLQEKGFLNNDPLYLITKFKEYKNLGFSSYYDFLKELFKAMMSEPNDRIYYVDEKFGRIVVTGPAPFLNGEFEDVEIPDEIFYIEGKTDLLKKVDPKKVKSFDVPILNLFESRDWTEGNIDEFVLGAIFEKLMTAEEKKEKGAYYTPEPITEYICNNTIKPYLIDKINEKFGTKYKSLDEFFEKDRDEERYRFLFDELQNIKILDPACGSGHFLETAINILVEIYEEIRKKAKEFGFSKENFVILTTNEKGELIKESLLSIEDNNERILKLKFHIIISRNIYGVDILPSAIKVARARLFLSLAKHFDAKKEIYVRFPNVHFNLRVGNSLIGFFDFSAFEKIKSQATLREFFPIKEKETLDIELDKELEEYIKKMDKLLGTDAYLLFLEVKKEFNKELTKNMLKKVLKLRSDLIKILLVSLNTNYAVKLKRLIDEITKRFNEKLNGEYIKYLNRKGIKIDKNKLEEIGHFHWIMEFSEVFLEKGGFDIIIGNPPHGAKLKIIEKDIVVNMLFNSSETAILFIIRSIQLGNIYSRYSLVIPKQYAYNDKWSLIREFMIKNTSIEKIIDIGNAFKGQSNEQIIIVWNKRENRKNFITGIFRKNTVMETACVSYRFYNVLGIFPLGLEESEIIIGSYLQDKSKYYFLNFVEGHRGLPRRYKSQEGVLCYDKKDINRFYVNLPITNKVDIRKLNNRKLTLKMKKHKIVAQRILSFTTVPQPRIIIKAYLDSVGVLTFETVTNIYLSKENCEWNLPALCVLLNSTFTSWYVQRFIYTKYFQTSKDFDIKYIQRIRVPKTNKGNIITLSIICYYLLFLNAKEDWREKYKGVINFFDKKIADSLIYELYFKEKFYEDGSYPEPKEYLLETVSKHLKPINYDRWAELYWRKQLGEKLSEKEEQELKQLGEQNLKTINEVYKTIREDNEIRKLIEKIKSHKWIKVIEGGKNE